MCLGGGGRSAVQLVDGTDVLTAGGGGGGGDCRLGYFCGGGGKCKLLYLYGVRRSHTAHQL